MQTELFSSHKLRPGLSPDEQVFLGWAEGRRHFAKGSKRSLSDKSLEDYFFIWRSWLRWLTGQQLGWKEADEGQARRFLEQLSTRSGARTAAASTVTQRRYWRVLDQFYRDQVLLREKQDEKLRNPFAKASVATNEQMDSLAFNALQWRALLAQVPAPGAGVDLGNWQGLRDRAILWLMLGEALTVSEIIQLSLADLSHPLLVAGRPRRLTRERDADTPLTLRVSGKGLRKHQARTRPLQRACTEAMLAWLQARSVLGAPQDTQAKVFVSRKYAKGQPMSRVAIFMLAKAHVTAALDANSAHAGPAALRNSAILSWMEAGSSDAEVAARAGLKDESSLRRLRRHLVRADRPDGIRADSAGEET